MNKKAKRDYEKTSLERYMERNHIKINAKVSYTERQLKEEIRRIDQNLKQFNMLIHQ